MQWKELSEDFISLILPQASLIFHDLSRHFILLALSFFIKKKKKNPNHNTEGGRPDDSSVPPNPLLRFHSGFHTSWSLCQPASASQPSSLLEGFIMEPSIGFTSL